MACAPAARAPPPGDTYLEFAKLTAPTTGANAEIGGGELGGSAAISADGTTALVGAFDDASGAGAAYVFTRSGATWTLQAKLTAPTTGASRAIGTDVEFGGAVALSADGNTALIGGFGDNSDAGGGLGLHARSVGLERAAEAGRTHHRRRRGARPRASSAAASRSTPPEPPR